MTERKELKSEDIKNAIVARLLDIAPQYDVYKEAMTVPTYPYFFVHLIKVDDTPMRAGYHNLRYSFDLRYRVASDPSTNLRLQADLDDMALQLITAFNLIECTDGTKYHVEDKDYEKTDGVLHFFFKITAQIKIVDTEDIGKLGELESVNIATRR